MIVAIIGESSSGKSSLVNEFVKRNPSFSKVITYTTRPKRPNEIEGVDYYFITDDEFARMTKEGFFLEYISYRGWHYGTPKIEADQNSIVVLNPPGARALRRSFPESALAKLVYLCVDRKSRMIKLLERGDNIDEAYRRNLSDQGQFMEFELEADYVIKNKNYERNLEDICKELENFLEA